MRTPLFTALVALVCGTALAQQANVNLDYSPQKNTESLTPFSAPLNSPDVRDDRTVTFRVKAPEARSVMLVGPAILVALGQGRPVPFQKGADGVWALTVGPLRPDRYVYHFDIDGIRVADPSNTIAGFTATHNWVFDGRVNFMMDNLLAEAKAVPMIIAIPNNQVVHRNHPKHAELTFTTFEAELRKHVIPLVEQHYSARKNPKSRALSGLSMGGRHTMSVGFKSLDLFGSFGVLSAGDPDAETSLAGFLNDPAVNRKVDYLFIGQGTAEASGRFGERVAALRSALLKHDVKHEYYVGGHGGHDWSTWRHLLHEKFLPGLWRK